MIDKKTALELVESIKHDHRAKTGLIKPTASVSKYQLDQLLAVYNFIIANPTLTDADIKKVLKCKPKQFGYVLKLEKKVNNFFEELKAHGVMTMVESLNHDKDIEDFAKENL